MYFTVDNITDIIHIHSYNKLSYKSIIDVILNKWYPVYYITPSSLNTFRWNKTDKTKSRIHDDALFHLCEDIITYKLIHFTKKKLKETDSAKFLWYGMIWWYLQPYLQSPWVIFQYNIKVICMYK